MNYYYLIATLPNLSLDETNAVIDYEGSIDTIRRNLDGEDKTLFEWLLYPNDHRNVLNVLFHQYHERPMSNKIWPSTVDVDMIAEYLHHPYYFPSHIADFLVADQDRFQEMSMTEIENRLDEYFYQNVTNLSDRFLQDYFNFDRILKSIVTGTNRSIYTFHPKAEQTEDPYIVDNLMREGVGMSPLNRAYPFLESLKEVLGSKDPLLIEKKMDAIRWSFIDENIDGFFNRQQVFGYTLKLLMVYRWDLLNKQNDGTYLQRLSERIKASSKNTQTKAA